MSELDRYFRDEVVGMQPYVPGEQPQSGKFIKLNTNENPYPPSPAVQQAIQQASQTRLERYPDPLGTAFRMRAADIYGVSPDHILCGNGSDDILTILTRGFVGTGKLLRLPYPSYILYRTLAQLQGARWEEVPFRSDFSLDDAFARPDPDLKLVVLPNPNSPSGTVLPPEQILKLADRLPCPLVVDEAYADFADSHCIDLVRVNPKIMITRTLSKSYGLAGLRFGFLIADPRMVAMLRKVKDSYNCDCLAIAGATAAIDDQAWFQANRAKILATRQNMIGRAKAAGFETTPSQANFVWCTHPTRNVQALYQKLKDQRVLVRYMNYPGWGDGLRISVGTNEQSEIAMQMLASL
jgi:histidinol-phosphate aminotransferase